MFNVFFPCSICGHPDRPSTCRTFHHRNSIAVKDTKNVREPPQECRIPALEICAPSSAPASHTRMLTAASLTLESCTEQPSALYIRLLPLFVSLFLLLQPAELPQSQEQQQPP